MKHLLLIFLGGGLGSCLRYLLSKNLNSLESAIPYGTLTVNSIGCLFIGILLGYTLKSDSLSSPMLLLLVTGFCGGFTTFSAFALENYELLKAGDFMSFFLYAFGSLALGILAVSFGVGIVKIVD